MRLLPSRYFGRATGQHRRPHAAIVNQRFAHCPACGVDTAATVHGQVLRCAEGHEIHGGAR